MRKLHYGDDLHGFCDCFKWDIRKPQPQCDYLEFLLLVRDFNFTDLTFAESLSNLLKDNGAKYTTKVNENCTHLVVSEKDFEIKAPKGEAL